MAINIGSSKIKNIYMGSTPVKAVFLGSEKIYPMEIVYQESGYDDFDRTFNIPEGYKTLKYRIEIITGDNVHIILYNNNIIPDFINKINSIILSIKFTTFYNTTT